MGKFGEWLKKNKNKIIGAAIAGPIGTIIGNKYDKENEEIRQGEEALDSSIAKQQGYIDERQSQYEANQAAVSGMLGQSPQFDYQQNYNPLDVGLPEYTEFQPQYDPMGVRIPEYDFSSSYDPLSVNLPESVAYTPLYDPMSVQTPEYNFTTDIDPMSVAMPGTFDYTSDIDPLQAELSPEVQQALSLAKSRAGRTEMPGQSLLEAKLARQGASAVQNVREMGGGIAGLGAISDIYGKQQESLSDLAIQSAMYRDQAGVDYQNSLFSAANNRMANQQMLQSEEARRFAQAQGTYQSQLAGSTAERQSLQSQLGLESDIYGRQYSAQAQQAQNLQNMMMQQNVFGADIAQQQYSNQFNAAQAQRNALQGAQQFEANQAQTAYSNQFNAAQAQREAMMQQNQFSANQYQQSYANQFNAAQAQREATAQQQQFDYGVQQQNYMYNQYNPYQQQLNWAQNEVVRTDPFAAQMGLYGDQAGLALMQQQQAMLNKQNMTNMLFQLGGMGLQAGLGVASGGLSTLGKSAAKSSRNAYNFMPSTGGLDLNTDMPTFQQYYNR